MVQIVRLVEPCCGSAALTVHLIGGERRVVPYQGSKWSMRRELRALLPQEPLESVWLNDPGPWGATWEHLYHDPHRVIEHLRQYAERDPRTVYDEIHGREAAPKQRALFAAQYLFLQRLAFSGKAVGLARDGRCSVWKSPGFNETSAYGKPTTARFGRVKPMIPSLIQALEEADWKWPDNVEITELNASEMQIRTGATIYFDPPYSRSTGYPNHALDRKSVLALAERWSRGGSDVYVSEGCPLKEEGTIQISRIRSNGSPFKRTGKPEWVSMWKRSRDEE